MKMKKKKAWLAGILNFLVWGVGYLYNGKRKVTGWLFVAAMVIGAFATSTIAMNDYASWVSYVLFNFALGYDAYTEAKEINKAR